MSQNYTIIPGSTDHWTLGDISESLLESLANHVSALIWVAGEGRFTFWFNHSWSSFTGLSMDASRGRGWLESVHEEDRNGVLSVYAQSYEKRESFSIEYRLRRNDGIYRWVLDNGNPAYLRSGEFVGFTGSLVDITSRKDAEAALSIAAAAFETNEGILVTDESGCILRVNRAFIEITGYTSEESVGKTPAFLKSGRHDRVFYQKMWDDLLSTGQWRGEIWNKKKCGEVYPEWLTITAVKDAGGRTTHYVGVFEDVTNRLKAEAEIERLAFFDPLTLLPNRRLFFDRLNMARLSVDRSKKHGAVILVDLDHFKVVNDTLGHDKGDQLLLDVANRLSSCVREMDTVARIGGDEFMILILDLDSSFRNAAEMTEDVCQRILESFCTPFEIDDRMVHISPSMGVTLFQDRKTTTKDLIKQVDMALYQAKAAGRNVIRFFEPVMQSVMEQRSFLNNEMHKALVENQFIIHYQPQIDCTGSIVGAEALVRWIHPVRGVVSPDSFISLAEETGFIIQLGKQILEQVCNQIVVWNERPESEGIILAVNVSGRQFTRPDFVSQVKEVLEKTGANPRQLKIELTESVLIHDKQATRGKMESLREMGVTFSLDDFGTGYSSLAYLNELPLDQLKVDQSFVCNLMDDPANIAIPRAIISMGKSLGLSIIAEGVEETEQWQALKEEGCDQFQGYLFGKPLPPDEFIRTIGNEKQASV